jgi:hypothetical protein
MSSSSSSIAFDVEFLNRLASFVSARARNRMMSSTMYLLFVSEGEKTRTHNREKVKTRRVGTISISIPRSDDECCRRRLPTGNKKKEPMTKVSDSRRWRILIRVKEKKEME